MHADVRRVQIGAAITGKIAARSEAVTVLATARNPVDLKLKPANPASKVAYIPFDATSDESAATLLQTVKTDSEGKVDVVIITAGGPASERQDTDKPNFDEETVRDVFALSEFKSLLRSHTVPKTD